jgi:hypothetical protein
MTESQAQTTRFLARALGPFLLLVAAAIFVRYETLPLLWPAYMQDPPLIMVTGALVLLFGVFMLAAHHHFGSPAAIVVTILAVMFVIRGAVLLIAPEVVMSLAAHVVRAPPIFLVVNALFALVGLWLTFVGWFAKPV